MEKIQIYIGTVRTKNTYYTSNTDTTYDYNNYQKSHYIITRNKDKKFMIISMETKKAILIPSDIEDSIGINQEESTSGNYLIIKSDRENKDYVYDKNLNKIYESDNSLEYLTDNYIIEHSKSYDDNSIFLVNIDNNNEKKQIEVKGRYKRNNDCFLITEDENKSYLYVLK